ncbi:hypothetical protein WMY93_032151 [Mugilogobius chulae]|uniref:Sushi domain-containing protein n=1 Tax=Mugilogobius chulae TaxID=88201 RepID=A0AAW0MEM1_9GOBI
MKPTVTLLLFLWGFVHVASKVEECSKLPSEERAFVLVQYKKAEYQKGDVVYFSCDPGYTTGLNTSYKCTEAGWVLTTVGNCVAEDSFPVLLGCTPPPHLRNGYIVRNTTLFYSSGQKAAFQCDNLYTMRGGPYMTCTNGQWTGDIHCLIDSCLRKLAIARCRHGNWVSLPVCEKIDSWCGPPPQIPNAVAQLQQFHQDMFPEDTEVKRKTDKLSQAATSDHISVLKDMSQAAQWSSAPGDSGTDSHCSVQVSNSVGFSIFKSSEHF